MADAHSKHHDYHIIDPSPWPFTGSVGALVMAFGVLGSIMALELASRCAQIRAVRGHPVLVAHPDDASAAALTTADAAAVTTADAATADAVCGAVEVPCEPREGCLPPACDTATETEAPQAETEAPQAEAKAPQAETEVTPQAETEAAAPEADAKPEAAPEAAPEQPAPAPAGQTWY